MSSCVGGEVKSELLPYSFKLKVQKDFRFKVFYDNKGVRNFVKKTVICHHCYSELQYTGSLTNISFHVQQHQVLKVCYLLPCFVTSGNKLFHSSLVQ